MKSIENKTLLQRRREECERKARRGEMDPRLEFVFQLLIDATGLLRHEIMDHIFDGDMLDEINLLFQPHTRNKLIWYYQDVEDQDNSLSLEVGASKSGMPGARGPGTLPPVKTLGASQQQQQQPQQPPPVKKKLFLTDGWTTPLTGICIFLFRLNTHKPLPEESFHKVSFVKDIV